MSKRKKSNAKNQSNILKTIAWILATVALLMSALTVGYYLGYENAKEEVAKKAKNKEQRRVTFLKKMQTQDIEESVNKRLKEVLKKEIKAEKELTQVKPIKKEPTPPLKKQPPTVKAHAGASHEYDSSVLAKPPSRVKRQTKVITATKPRLAIIMDDVSVKSQVNAIKSLGLNITMSFLPPSPARPHSAKLASEESFYMVHLPMEAQSFNAEEPSTLRINDSQQKVAQIVKNIKTLFPHVKYINNHTGSKYTANETAMNRLIVALNANNISFIDSRTTAATKVPMVMKNFGLKYVARDVFLDHHMDKPYIKEQIKKAIKIAKNEGVAIAIGHPHANTILALHESKKLFKDIELVLINKVY